MAKELENQPNPEEDPEVQEETAETKDLGVEWTSRMEAIARGEDPDAEPEEEEEEEEPEADPGSEEESDEELAEDDSEESDEEGWAEDEDVQILAATYGLSTRDIATFSSREEFERALALIDRMTPQATQVPGADPEGGKNETKDDGEPEKFDKNGFINPEFYKANDFGEETVALVEALRKTQEQVAGQNKRMAEEAQTAELNAFHDAVDMFDAEFYGTSIDDNGRPVNIDRKFADRRSALLGEAYATAERIARRQKAAGQPVQLPPWRVLVKQADKALFSEDRAKMAAADKKKKATAQSKRKRPVSSVAGTRPAARVKQPNPRDATEIANDPDIIKFLERVGARN